MVGRPDPPRAVKRATGGFREPTLHPPRIALQRGHLQRALLQVLDRAGHRQCGTDAGERHPAADASKRLSALKGLVEAARAVKAADAGETIDPARIHASISRLEALLERLESR